MTEAQTQDSRESQCPIPSEDKTQVLDDSNVNPDSQKLEFDEDEIIQLLHEGNGECIVNAPDESIFDDFVKFCKKNNAEITRIEGTTSVLIRQLFPGQYIDMRVAFAGNVDAGKSSLVGLLSNGKLDDGRGSARSTVFVHRHEAQTGRTSALAQHIIGFDQHGNIVNYDDKYHGGLQDYVYDTQDDKKKSLVQQQNWKEIVERSAKIVTLHDLPGHEAYLRTAVFGMVGQIPHYCCVVVGANMGVLKMSKEHISLALALKIPLIFVVTKIDICPPNILKETLASINKILKLPGVRRLPYLVKNRSDVLKCVANMKSGRICPIILMSSVTGENVDLVKMLFNTLPVKRNNEELMKEPPEFVIDATFFVSGIGTVVSGILHQGTVSVGDTLKLGPDGNGEFRDVSIKSIHCKRVPVEKAFAGQQVSFALKKERRSNIRKGQVIVAKELAFSCWEFEADIHVLYHSTTIKVNYQPVIHCLCTRQAAKIVWMDAEELRTRDKARVRFRFMFRPAYLKEGETFIIREGRCKGVGRITKLFKEPLTDTSK